MCRWGASCRAGGCGWPNASRRWGASGVWGGRPPTVCTPGRHAVSDAPTGGALPGAVHAALGAARGGGRQDMFPLDYFPPAGPGLQPLAPQPLRDSAGGAGKAVPAAQVHPDPDPPPPRGGVQQPQGPWRLRGCSNELGASRPRALNPTRNDTPSHVRPLAFSLYPELQEQVKEPAVFWHLCSQPPFCTEHSSTSVEWQGMGQRTPPTEAVAQR